MPKKAKAKAKAKSNPDIPVPYGRARPNDVLSIALIESPGGTTITQPEQSSSSLVAHINVLETPGGSKRIGQSIQTEGGRVYHKRKHDLVLTTSENHLAPLSFSGRLSIYSPQRSKEEKDAIKQVRFAKPTSTHHGRGGSSKFFRPKVDLSQSLLNSAGVDNTQLQQLSQELPATQMEETTATILQPQKAKRPRKSTINIMGRSAREEFATLLEQVAKTKIAAEEKQNLITYLELNVSTLQTEWTHMTAHSHAGAVADTCKNLGAGTERANTQMITSEYAATSLAKQDFEVTVKTRFNKFSGTEVLKLIQHVVTVTAKDQESTITLVNTISNLASPEWEDLPKTTDPQLVAEVLRALLNNTEPRATFKIKLRN